MRKIGDKVKINVITEFQPVMVEFTIIDVLNNHKYALIAHHKVVVGQEKLDGSWTMSKVIELSRWDPIEGFYHNPVI